MSAVRLVTPRQCRAGRALLGLTQPQLAELAGLNIRTLIDFEGDVRTTSRGTRLAIAVALMDAGVELMDGQGVALRNELEAA